MAKKWSRIWVRMRNPETGSHYMTQKNKINTPDKLELVKYDKKLRKRVKFVEYTKKLH